MSSRNSYLSAPTYEPSVNDYLVEHEFHALAQEQAVLDARKRRLQAIYASTPRDEDPAFYPHGYGERHRLQAALAARQQREAVLRAEALRVRERDARVELMKRHHAQKRALEEQALRRRQEQAQQAAFVQALVAAAAAASARPETQAKGPSSCCAPKPQPNAPATLPQHPVAPQPRRVRVQLHPFFHPSCDYSGPKTNATPAPKATPPVRPTLESVLKQRLGGEQDAEVQQVIAGILAAVSASQAAQSAPTTRDAPAPAPVPAPDAARTAALATIASVAGSFKTLSSSFTFPTDLDLSPPSRPSSPTPSTTSFSLASTDWDTTSTGASALPHTRRNRPVHAHAHALAGLLVKLDAVESAGDEVVRAARRGLVMEIERALEEMDGVVDRLRGTQEDAVVVVDREEAVDVSTTAADAGAVVSAAEAIPYNVEDEAPIDGSTVDEALDEQTASAQVSESPIESARAVVEGEASIPIPASELDRLSLDALVAPVLSEQLDESDSTDDLDASDVTVKAHSSEPAVVDTFLLPIEPAESPAQNMTLSDSEDGDDVVLVSDEENSWSEVDA